MATAGSIVVDLLMRTGSFETDAQRAAKAADKRFKEIQKSANDAGRGIGDAFKGVLAGAIFGVGVSQVFGKFVEETKNAQNEQAQLKAALQSTGQAAGFSADQLNRMATQLAGKSIFGEGDINSAQTRLLSYTGVVGDQFPRALQAAIDMSARLGTSLEQSSETIGKALDVPSQGLTALSKQGFRFTEDQKKLVESLESTGRTAEAQGIILSALETAYGGAAEAARNTFGGSLTALQEQINSLMTGDDDSVNGLTDAINDLTDLLGSAETKAAFASFIGFMVDVSTALVKMANDFVNGMAAAEGFIDSLLTYGTINPFNSDRENVTKYTDQLKEAVAWRDRLLSEGKTDAADTVSGKIKQIQNQLNFSRSRANLQENQTDTTALGWAGSVPTMAAIPVIGSAPKKVGKASARSGGTKQERDEGAALVAQLEKRVALTGDLTERQKLLIDIEQGYTKFKSEQDKMLALGYADTLDFIKEQDDAYKSAQETLKELSKVTQKTTSEMDQFTIQAARNIQDALGEGLVDLLEGNFDNIGKSWSQMIIRMAANAAAANLGKALFGDYGNSGKAGGILGEVSNYFFGQLSSGSLGGSYSKATSVGAATGDVSGLSYLGKAFADGGYTGQGGKYDPAGVVHAGEYVINADATRKLGRAYLDRLNGYADGGLVGAAPAGVGGATEVRVINQTSNANLEASSATTRFDGDRVVTEIILRDRKRNGPISRAMRGA
ncbi:phage tail length tape measure family protein [Schauerella aestuarii]|uniref:phage tail length tape measure family protein n=1 Tax=Schauerella aestuarii TaxID=2511204 RepID=UPI00136ADD28|nr:phage tail length tape measure family protein [Achromobacter aestuarii]MYZ41423.1 hypothetical protein [Achromobacter aestuarii]